MSKPSELKENMSTGPRYALFYLWVRTLFPLPLASSSSPSHVNRILKILIAFAIYLTNDGNSELPLCLLHQFTTGFAIAKIRFSIGFVIDEAPNISSLVLGMALARLILSLRGFLSSI